MAPFDIPTSPTRPTIEVVTSADCTALLIDGTQPEGAAAINAIMARLSAGASPIPAPLPHSGLPAGILYSGRDITDAVMDRLYGSDAPNPFKPHGTLVGGGK